MTSNDTAVPAAPAHPLVVMGVSGSGKSTVGRTLAVALGRDFVDADDLHPAANKAKMAEGIPLDDDDRWPWLGLVGEALAAHPAPVVACSALKRGYRDALRQKAPDARFIELDLDRGILLGRLLERAHEFMSPTLLDSQLDTLQPLEGDEAGFRIDGSTALIPLVAAIRQRLGADGAPAERLSAVPGSTTVDN